MKENGLKPKMCGAHENTPQKKVGEYEEKNDVYLDEPDTDVDLEVDGDDAIVHPVDGVFIGGDDEEIKLWFFYVKPNTYSKDDTLKCKCIAEFRVTPSTFKYIVEEFNERLQSLKKHRKTNNNSSQEETMFA